QHPVLRIDWFTIIPFCKDMSGEFPHILSLVMASSPLRSETVRARRKIFICTRVLQLYLLAHCCIIFCWSCDGYVTVEAVRLIVTFSVSTGCLSMSSVRLGNSAISSRNNTPRCARDTSPGFGFAPPPISETADAEWCGSRNGGI